MIYEKMTPHGVVVITIEEPGVLTRQLTYKNTVMNAGKTAIINGLINDNHTYVSNVIFGDGGWDRQEKALNKVKVDKNDLYGIIRANKPVIAQRDPELPTQAIFSVTLPAEEMNDYPISEIGLQLDTGDLLGMVTFPELNKTDQMKITLDWYFLIL